MLLEEFAKINSRQIANACEHMEWDQDQWPAIEQWGTKFIKKHRMATKAGDKTSLRYTTHII